MSMTTLAASLANSPKCLQKLEITLEWLQDGVLGSTKHLVFTSGNDSAFKTVIELHQQGLISTDELEGIVTMAQTMVYTRSMRQAHPAFHVAA